MKRLLPSLLIIALLLIPLTACGGAGAVEEASPEAEIPAKPSDEAPVEELFHTLSLPSALFKDEDMTNFDLEAYARKQDFDEARLEEDGSVSITVTEKRHNQLLSEIRDEVEKNLAGLVKGEDYQYVKAVDYSEDFSQITISVDRELFEAESFDILPLLCGMLGCNYQMYAGIEQRVEIIYKDADSGKSIKTVFYPEAEEAESGSSEAASP